MNLDTIISKELMGAISRSYEAELYTAAVLDALHFLSDIIREKAEVDGDGVALAGQAFGGEAPKLRLNKLQTQSEKDEQKGFEQLVRGLYQGIRNPRSHERVEDGKSAADAIILFVNFLHDMIGKAKPAFTTEDWIELVFDPYYVSGDADYAKLIASQVPAKKRFDAMINVYRRKSEADLDNLAQVMGEMAKLFDSNQMDDFMKEVSAELRTARDRTGYDYDEFGNITKFSHNGEQTIRTILRILPSELWPRLDKIAKKRIENQLIQSIESGKYDVNTDECSSGSLGTWAQDFIAYFENDNKRRLYEIFVAKLTGQQAERDYTVSYFGNAFPDTLTGGDDDGDKRRGYFDAVYEMLSKAEDKKAIGSRIAWRSLFPNGWGGELQKKLRDPSYEPDRNVFGFPEISDEDIPF